ncbi:winged helix-turn-helix transcriptional regulator [Sanyastnella coralliicola]|uniref:winged helix-turn-helix transcriptional regulator n=1 Tax=Sanyastnella coralliicola TaxID=3069118 RepID=UPI0027BA181F|nr:helix-turn-helix domain-containing protein [Longitalea sp. SCSIO 12813]
MAKKGELRSDCPINYALEFLGDKWTLLIIRDLVFDGKRFYKEFLSSKEKIATNILSDRLKRLESIGILVSSVYEKQRTQKIYKLTQKGIDLTPMLIEIIIWSTKYKEGLNVSPEFLKKLEEDKEKTVAGVVEAISSRLKA